MEIKEFKEIFGKAKNAKEIRENTLDVQMVEISERITNLFYSREQSIVLEKEIIYPEISEEIINFGFDVIIHRGINMNESWTEISWENAKDDDRIGEIKEV